MKPEYKTVEEYHAEMKRVAGEHNVDCFVEPNADEYLDEFEHGMTPLEAVKAAYDNANSCDDPFHNS